MKKRNSVIGAVNIIALTFIAIVSYQCLKHIHSNKFLMGIIALICAVGSYILLMLAFTFSRKKQKDEFRSV
jgi:uncharacterized phage infection (PIP) family protein YhgE